MDYKVRYLLKHCFVIDHTILALVRSGTDEESKIVASILTEPWHWSHAASLLQRDGRPIAILYAALIGGRPELVDSVPLDHSLVDYMKARTTEDHVHVARKWNEPLAYDILVARDPIKYMREAALAGSIRGMRSHALYDDDLTSDERRQLMKRTDVTNEYYPWRMQQLAKHSLDRYRIGRLLYAMGSDQLPSDTAYYLDQRDRATRAVVAWLLCARRLHLYKDVARLVGQMVLRGTPVLYERVGTRRSKRLKCSP